MEFRMPKVREVLAHRFRPSAGRVPVTVVSTDRDIRSVNIRMDGSGARRFPPQLKRLDILKPQETGGRTRPRIRG